MAFGAAEIIMFGIQAGTRLYGQARQAYVERTQERDLVLPLPGLDHQSTVTLAFGYFAGNADGRRHVARSARLRELHAKASAGIQQFKSEDKEGAKEYVELYDYHRQCDRGITSNDGLMVDDIIALNTVAQWRRGETPHPTAIRRIAGTITEVGIDFFVSGPGAGRLGGNAPATLLLREVLTALDDHSFVAEGLEGAVEKIFISTLDFIAENPAIVSGDAAMQTFVSGVAGGVVGDIQQRIDALPENERLFAADRLGEVARAVFRSVVRNGAETVLSHPGTFLGTDAGGQSAMASRLGTIVVDTVLPEGDDGVDLSALATGETLDRLVKGALGVIAEHPELMGIENPGIQKILEEVAGELSVASARLGPDLFPEVARLVLERTGANLDVLWSPEGDGKNLAVTAAKTLLAELSREPAAGAWRPALSKSQVLNVVEAVLDDVAANPALVTRQVGGKPALEAAVKSVLDGLAAQELDHFSGTAAAGILAGGVKAAIGRWEILTELPADAGTGRLALQSVVDTVLAGVTGGDVQATWKLTEGRILVAIFDQSFAKLAEFGIDEDSLSELTGALATARENLEQGGRFSVDLFARDLELRLAA